jgi:hypothetical protein
MRNHCPRDDFPSGHPTLVGRRLLGPGIAEFGDTHLVMLHAQRAGWPIPSTVVVFSQGARSRRIVTNLLSMACIWALACQ